MRFKTATGYASTEGERAVIGDMSTDANTLDNITRCIYDRIEFYNIPVSTALPELEGIANHPNLSAEVMRSLLFVVAKCGVADTRPLIDSMKQNEKAMAFVSGISKGNSMDHGIKAFSIDVAADLILAERRGDRLIRTGTLILLDQFRLRR